MSTSSGVFLGGYPYTDFFRRQSYLGRTLNMPLNKWVSPDSVLRRAWVGAAVTALLLAAAILAAVRQGSMVIQLVLFGVSRSDFLHYAWPYLARIALAGASAYLVTGSLVAPLAVVAAGALPLLGIVF